MSKPFRKNQIFVHSNRNYEREPTQKDNYNLKETEQLLKGYI